MNKKKVIILSGILFVFILMLFVIPKKEVTYVEMVTAKEYGN